jgi:hypothetical protein
MSGILQQALAPFTLKGFYLVTWGTALGANVFHSLVSCYSREGIVGRGSLPQDQTITSWSAQYRMHDSNVDVDANVDRILPML